MYLTCGVCEGLLDQTRSWAPRRMWAHRTGSQCATYQCSSPSHPALMTACRLGTLQPDIYITAV